MKYTAAFVNLLQLILVLTFLGLVVLKVIELREEKLGTIYSIKENVLFLPSVTICLEEGNFENMTADKKMTLDEAMPLSPEDVFEKTSRVEIGKYYGNDKEDIVVNLEWKKTFHVSELNWGLVQCFTSDPPFAELEKPDMAQVSSKKRPFHISL